MEVGATTAAQQQRKRKSIPLSKTKLFHLHLMAVLPSLPEKLLLFLTQLVEAREVVESPEAVEVHGDVIPLKGLGKILLRGLHKTLEALDEEMGEEVEEEKEVKRTWRMKITIVLIYLLLFYCNHLFFPFNIIKLQKLPKML